MFRTTVMPTSSEVPIEVETQQRPTLLIKDHVLIVSTFDDEGVENEAAIVAPGCWAYVVVDEIANPQPDKG